MKNSGQSLPEEETLHSRYGAGRVVAERHGGFEKRVLFRNGLERWVRLDDLEDVNHRRRPESFTGPKFQPIPDEKMRARQLVEAFRLGIVPCSQVEDFTFGRGKEMEKLRNWLRAPSKGTLRLVGEYGTGKSHLLGYARGRALQDGFAVASVEMDPNENPFHKPKRVYSRLVRSFRYVSRADQGERGFRDFLKEALDAGFLGDHHYFSRLAQPDEDLWNWIEAREASPRPVPAHDPDYRRYQSLFDFSTAANVYCYLISGLGWAAREALGLKGLLLLFDEAESLAARHTPYQSQRGRHFLTALARMAGNNRRLLRHPGISGLPYARHANDIPFLYRIPCGVKLLLAFASDYDWRRISELKGTPRLELNSLSVRALREVFEQVCARYREAYHPAGDFDAGRLFASLKSRRNRTRTFIKGSVEVLDWARFNPGKPLKDGLSPRT